MVKAIGHNERQLGITILTVNQETIQKWTFKLLFTIKTKYTKVYTIKKKDEG